MFFTCKYTCIQFVYIPRGALLRTGHEHGKLLTKQVWFAFADLISALSGVPPLSVCKQ